MSHSADSLFDSSDDALVGTLIGDKFALRSCVGVGASGTVYQADQTALGRTVAVKVLRPELASDPRFVRRFNDEALAASRLNHPNVVSVIDFGQTPCGLLYLVMEYLRGATLTHVLRTETLTDERIADILTQMLSALEEAHAAGVVHADVKADNIVVERRRGGWDLVKVVDFGIARLVGEGQNDEDEHVICGTPEYMAPEVIRGVEPTFAADIYSAGVILYELLTGVTPFSGAASMEVLRRHLEETPVPPGERCPERAMHPVLEAATLRALSKAPWDRFQSATDFRDALSAVTGRAATEDQVLCNACGTRSDQSFKFCPECGQPRRAITASLTAATLTAELGDDTRPSVAPEFYSDDTPTADLRPEDIARNLGRLVEPEETGDVGGILPLPLVGRDGVIARAGDLLRGPPGVTLHLAGPRGCGRTRLLREISEQVAESGTVVFLSGPDPSGLRAPFYPVRAVVAAILELPPLCPFEELGGALERLGLSRRDVPGIGELFGHEGNLWQLDPAIRRRELLAATLRVLRAAGKRHTTVLAFEDFDRFDHPSRDLIRRLAESNQRAPSLRLLVTSREDVELDWPSVDRIDLGPLDDEALRGLTAHFSTRGMPDLVTVDELRDKARRLPGHIHHLVRFGVEGGTIAGAPEALADLVGARLDFLPHDARLALQTAAVFGNEVTRSFLDQALDSLHPHEIDDALDILTARGYVRDDDGVLSFERAFSREVVYEWTPMNVRRKLHAAVGEILSPTVSDPALLGHHAFLAGELRRASELLARGGDNAVHQLDDHGASTLYNRALVAARQLMLLDDDNANRVRFVSTSIRLADTLRAANEVALARGVVDEATDYCRDSPTLRAQLLRATAHLASTGGEIETAIASLREAIGLVIPTGAPELLCELYLDLATMQLRIGNSADATRELEEGLDLVTLGEGARTPHGPRRLWAMLLRLAQIYGSAGKIREAVQAGEHAHRHANQAESPLGAARAQALLANLHDQLEEYARADIYRRRAIAAMRGLGDRRGTAELLLSSSRATQSMRRITPASIREARVLAEEVGWSEGVRRAKGASTPPPADETI